MQHDYNIANDSGANVRADLNNVLAAIKTMNSGATAPSATSAGMSWFDTSDANTWYWKLRNNSDDGWINVGALDVATDVFQPMIDDDLLTTYLTDNFYTETETDNLLDNKVDKVSSSDNAIVRFNGTTGQVQNSGVTINDSNRITANELYLSGKINITGSGLPLINVYDTSIQQSLAYIGADAAIFNNQGYHKFNINGSERMRILSSGGITFNGDTSPANALDDYEEGGFTVYFRDVSGNTSSTTTTGYYVKIGKSVTVSFNVSNINTSGLNSGEFFKIDGLPYISTSTEQHGNFKSDRINFQDGTVNCSLFLPTSSNHCYLAQTLDSGADYYASVGQIASNQTDISGTITYITV